MNFWEYFHQHTFLAFVMIVGSLQLLYYLTYQPWRLLMRHLNIRSQGWPPPHLDADGDQLQESYEEEDE